MARGLCRYDVFSSIARRLFKCSAVETGPCLFFFFGRCRFKDFARRFKQRAQSERRTLPAAFLSSLAWFPMGHLEGVFRTIGNTQLAASRELAAAAGTGATPDAPQFAFPVCLIWGEEDHTCPVAGAHEIAKFIPRAEVHVLKGAYGASFRVDFVFCSRFGLSSRTWDCDALLLTSISLCYSGHRHCVAIEHEVSE